MQDTTTALVNVWDDKEVLEQVKKTFANNLTEMEFMTFLRMGKATGLNPFLREIWAVKYGTGAAQIFIGRDGYRKVAQDHREYDYHQVDAVYSNDKFVITNGDVTHEYTLTDRGNLIGAYSIVKRKGSSKALFNFVSFKEYYNDKSPIWKDKPATMIKKVAEAQGLRGAFQGLFAGTYSDSENWKEESKISELTEQKNELENVPTLKILDIPLSK